MKKRVEYKENQHHVGKKIAWLKIAALLKSSKRENGLIQHVQPSQPALDRHLCSGLLDQLHSNETWTSGGKNSQLAWPADNQNHDANLHSRVNVKIIEKQLCEKTLNWKVSVDLRRSHRCEFKPRHSQQTPRRSQQFKQTGGRIWMWNHLPVEPRSWNISNRSSITKKLKKKTTSFRTPCVFIIFICCDVRSKCQLFCLISDDTASLKPAVITHTHTKLMRRWLAVSSDGLRASLLSCWQISARVSVTDEARG